MQSDLPKKSNPMFVRIIILVGITVAAFFLLAIWQGVANVELVLAQTIAVAVIALGLNIQWGYGGLFNFAIMGFMMAGGAAAVFVSYPVNAEFWASQGPHLLLRASGALVVGVLLVTLAHKSKRLGLKGGVHAAVVGIAWLAAYIIYRQQIDQAAAYIESTSGWVGGLGLHPVLGWIFGGIVAGGLGYLTGRICLGLRTDYLAIATIGISEIVRALVKNMDWLTRGTFSVSPVPWPTPLPQDLQAMGFENLDSFIYARLGFIVLTGDHSARLAALSEEQRFTNIKVDEFTWDQVMTPESVRGLFSTISPILALQPDHRQRTLDELERIAREEFGGEVQRTMITRLYTAQRKT